MELLVIARNPDPESRLGYLLWVPLEGGVAFRTSGTWPRTTALYCYPVPRSDWPERPDVVERAPVRSCRRRGAAIDLVLARTRENRSQIVYTTARGREAVFSQSPRTRKQARPQVRPGCGSRRAGDRRRCARALRPLRPRPRAYRDPGVASRRLRRGRRGPPGGGGGTQVPRRSGHHADDRGTPDVHTYPEFRYVMEGIVRNQGQEMKAGDGYAATAGSSHDDFATDSGATYVTIFRI